MGIKTVKGDAFTRSIIVKSLVAKLKETKKMKKLIALYVYFTVSSELTQRLCYLPVGFV